MAAQTERVTQEPVTYTRYSLSIIVTASDAEQLAQLASQTGLSVEEYVENLCSDGVLDAVNARLNGGN